MKKIDLHMHSTVSDGTDTPRELLERVREAGIGLFALTDHDAVRGCAEIREIRAREDPKLIAGAEFSCRDEYGKYHILGYRFDPDSAHIKRLVETGHRLRMEKARARLDLIRERFGIAFREEDVRELMSLDNPGKPHIAALMVRRGYARSAQSAFCEVLDRVHVPGRSLRPEEAIEGILAGGGIPVLAHPAFGGGNERITGNEMDERLRHLVRSGLQGLEAFYSSFSAELTEETLFFAKKYGLYVTAGSDYHGKNKAVPLGMTNLDAEKAVPDALRRFLERVED